jgi:hypothetical protein
MRESDDEIKNGKGYKTFEELYKDILSDNLL